MEINARVRHRLKIAIAALLLLTGAGLYGCVAARLPNVALAPRAEEASPPALGAFGADPPVQSWEDWRVRRAPLLREAFQANIYGSWPADAPGSVEKHPLQPAGFTGRLEQWRVSLGAAGAFNVGAGAKRWLTLYVTCVIAAGLGLLVAAEPLVGERPYVFASLLALATALSALKIHVPLA
ncbi:MAG TPA: hypothetical protein PLS69_13820, partial [Terricaulis sp.]|nr:hypothetical protein [Terricaulis sp.]